MSFGESSEAWPLREIVTGICVDWGVSIRRPCGAICFDTSSYHYKSRRTDQAAVERRIKEIAEIRVRYGYRPVHVLLRREGWVINMKKTRRIYNALGLQLRNKHPKRRVKAKLREDRQEAVGPNDVWAVPCPKGDCANAICRKGLRSRPARPGQEVAYPDHRRHVFPALPCSRSALHLSGRRCCADARTGLRADRLPQDDQSR